MIAGMINAGEANAANTTAGSSEPLWKAGISASIAITAKTKYSAMMIAIMISARTSQLPISVQTLPFVTRQALPKRILRSRIVIAPAGEKRTTIQIAATKYAMNRTKVRSPAMIAPSLPRTAPIVIGTIISRNMTM